MSNDPGGRRRDRRYSLVCNGNISVELQTPQGNRIKLPLLDLSVAGVAFEAPDWLSSAGAGSELGGVIVHVEDCTIHGRLRILHVTPRSHAGDICGAYFYPEGESEEMRLAALLSGLDAAQLVPNAEP